MAVAFDAVGPSSSGTGSATSPLTWTHVNGGNGILIGITIFNGSTNTVTGITYGGTTIPSLGFVQGGSGGAGGVALYGLVGATCPTGSNTVSVTFSDGANHNAGSISVSGAGSLGTAVTGTGTNTASVTANVTNTTTGGLIVLAASYGGTGLNTFSGTNGVTIQWQHPGSGNTGSDNGCGGTVASTGGGATQTVGVTDTGTDFWGLVAVEVLPATAAASPPPFMLSVPGLQSPAAFQFIVRPVSYDVTGLSTVNGTVQPLATRQPRRASARAVWKGFVSTTTNLQNGTVPDHLVVARRTAARAVWKGFVSSTTNLRNGNPPGGVVYRRKTARVYWRGFISSTTNLYNGNPPGGVVYRRKAARAVIYRGPAPFPPPIGTVPDHLVVARRAAARVVWRGFISSTTNLLNGNKPGSGLVKRRSASRVAWAGTVSRTVNVQATVPGTAPPHVLIARRTAARAVWRGFTSTTTNLLYGNPPGGLVRRRGTARAVVRGVTATTVNQVATISASPPLHLVVAHRNAARAVVRGTVVSTVNRGAGVVPPHLVVARRVSARAVVRGNPIAGLLPYGLTGGLVRRRVTARALWHGNTGSPVPVPTGVVPAGLFRTVSRVHSRALVRGVTVRTVNALPVAVPAPHERLIVPRRTAARGLWRGYVSFTVNRTVPQGVLFSSGQPYVGWSAGIPYVAWQLGQPYADWSAGLPYTGWRAGQPYEDWDAGLIFD